MNRIDDATLDRATDGIARLALAAAFLSAVAARFGLWGPLSVAAAYSNFLGYAAEVNSFAPVALVPYLAVTATLAETTLGVLLVAGVWRRPVALASAALLFLFGSAMAISFGPKEPLDDSVFSAGAAALLLARRAGGARSS